MSKYPKKPDFGTDPRNKSSLSLQGLANKGKSKRMPPPATLSTVAKKESIPETASTPAKQWGIAATPDTPDKAGRGDWASASSPYQPPRSRASVSNAEFPSLTAANGTPRDVTPQKETPSQRPMDRPPIKKPQENSSNQRTFNASNGTKYPSQRTGEHESRYHGDQRQPNYYNNQRSNQTNSRSNNSYSNRPPHRGRNNYPPHSRHHPPYDRDEGVHEMFADGEAPNPGVKSLPTRHANFESDMDAMGWAGKQDNVDYTEKIKFDSSGDEDEDRVYLRKIGPPRISADSSQPPNKNQADPPLRRELTRTQQVPEFRSNSPDLQRPSGANTQSPICIMKRPISESTTETPVVPERGAESTTPIDEIPTRPIPQTPRQPQTTSMRHTVPALPSSSVRVSEKQRSSEQTPQPPPVQKTREDVWRQNKVHPLVVPSQSLPIKGSEPPTNVWEKRQQNEASEQQRQGLQGFPKLGENDLVQSLTIIPTKIAEKHESAGGRGSRGQDDDVFTQDKGAYHRERGQDSWEYRGGRDRHQSDDRRQYVRNNSHSKFGNEAEKSHNWRNDGNDTEERGNRYGDRGGRYEREGRFDRNDRDDRYNRGERYDRNDRGRRDDRSDRESRGPRRDNDWERNGSRNRFDGKQADNWRGERVTSNDKGQFRDGERRQFRDSDRGQFRDNNRGQFRDNDRGQFRDSEKRQFRDSERRPFRENDRDRGQFRDHDRGDKYGKKSSGEASSNNFSYASAVSNKGENEDEDWTADQNDERMKSETQDSWRQPRSDDTTGHAKYTQQRRMHPTFSDPPSTDAVPQNAEPAFKTRAEWTDLHPREDSRTDEGDRSDCTTPTEAGFTEIRKKPRGKGVFSGEAEATRSLGRGRGRPQEEMYGSRYQEGTLGSRSMTQPNKPLSSGTDSRFTRGSSPQKTQGVGRSRAPEKQLNTSPKRSTQKVPDYDKKATQNPRTDSPPLSQKSSTGAANNYVQPGISFSAIASKNIVVPPPPPPPGKSPQTDDKASDQSADSSDETEVVRKETRPLSDSFSPDLKIQDLSDKGEHLSDENDEVQEVMTTTIVNSGMVEELAEIDKTPHASLLAHSEQKEEIEVGFETADKAANDWNLLEDRIPTPQKQPDKPIEIHRHGPVPKLEERPRSITPQSTQPASTSAPAPERKKSDDPLPPPPSTVFPESSSHNILQPGFNTEWFNNPGMPTLVVGDVPSSLPFPYHTSQPQGMTDDDKVVRNKHSDLSEYVNAPEFLPLQFTESQYLGGSLATANFMSPNYTQEFTQQTMMQPLQPSMDATTTAGGLLTAPRMNPGYPNSQFHMNSVYPPNPLIPGNMGGTPLRPPTQQGMYGSMGGMRQFNTHTMHNAASITPFGVGNFGMPGNMRTAVMGADKNRRNDKMGMGDKVGSHPMYYQKLDQMGQYNPSLRKTSPTTFSPMVQQNLRNYTPNHRGGGNYNRGPRKSNNGNNSGYVKSYVQPSSIALPPSLHPSLLRPNQPFISLVGPVRAQQQPPHSAQMRNTSAPYRGKNMSYYPRQQQMPYANMFYYPQSNRTPHPGPHMTTVTTPSIEAAMPPNLPQQNLTFQVQTEADLAKSALGGPQFNIQMTEQILTPHKFHPFSTDPNAEDSVASEYSKIGPVAVNGKSDDCIGEKIRGDNLFIGSVPNIISSDPIQQGTPTDLTLKSHIEAPSSSPPSAMDIYGPAPLVSSSNLGSGSEIPSFQAEDTLSLPPPDKPQEEQAKSQVNLEP